MDLFHVPDRIPENAPRTYNLTREELSENVKKLQQWMETQQHIPEILDDVRLRNFIILNKGNIDKAKQKIDNYYNIRTQLSDMFTNINPRLANMQEIMKAVHFIPLPKHTSEMYRVLVFKIRDATLLPEIDSHDLMCYFGNVAELRLIGDYFYGDKVILDLDGINIAFMLKCSPILIHKIVTIYEEVYSTPVKAIIFVNSPSFINALMSILKSIMKPKLFQRIHIYKNTEVLKDNFPLDMLPKDYGGEERSLDELSDLLRIKFDQYGHLFDQRDQLRVNQQFRPKKAKKSIFGFGGNFKKLEVD